MRLLLLVLLLGLAQISSAQVCMPEAQPEPNSPYAYIRAEIKALQWIRYALTESQKIQPLPPANDPEWLNKAVNLYTVAQTVSDNYDCAVTMLTKYKNSNNESVRSSVDSLLVAIDTSKMINALLIEMMELTGKAEKPEDIDLVGIAKMLADVKMLQKDVPGIAMLGTKMSTFGILRFAGDGDDAKPVAFTITPTQRATLLSEVQELAKKKGQYTYVDGCADILLGALTKQLPTSIK